ncbi:MAG TPA: mannose-1-phosphate guanylyltransferase/mannose-6-phosphate isomerase [Spirochaetota bacterium]|nr:mannose-1-phosphate guanylyltransferase/mannose-6-phosphate isomerase [Spirochaetota bacterium]HQE59418.1 mannose-1-phosphate guanylyltransferase/mannose-6-phosphate isomerase [Spirochaetota bacterium]
MINIILCGGSGTRLWPLSRQMFPKQFVHITGETSLFQETVIRNSELCDKFCIVTNSDHQFIASHQLDELKFKVNEVTYLLEPVGRNTAPAIALACLSFDPEEIVFVTPSDHLIKKTEIYSEKVHIARLNADKGNLVTFGITAKYPETGYGYIEASSGNIDQVDSLYKVVSFREKPDKETAEKYLAAKSYYWNSGMFVFKAGVFLDELKKYSPDIYAKSKEAFESADIEQKNNRTIRIQPDKMKLIPSDSIDYAVMEKSKNVSVVASDIGWTDLGSFDSISDIKVKDENGNSFDGDVISIKSKNNLVFSGNRNMSLIGVDDLIIVDTSDALCIMKKGFSQDVKEVVSRLQNSTPQDKELTILHSTVHRPWGTYTVLEESKRFKIKKIVIKPGKRISLQKHLHRSEHWVVVSGTANVHSGGDDKVICKNESIYIPIGVNHRLSNEGKIDLVIIETQVGEYVGEDDIIRIDDDYKRC